VVDTDKRLEDLQTELVRMVETGNEEINAAQAYLQQTIAKWGSAIEQQRGRIAEREYTLSENAAQSHVETPPRVVSAEMVETYRDAARNGS
jgi:hypothetical protein